MNLRRIRVAFAVVAAFSAGLSLPAQTPVATQKADSVLILKKQHVLELLARGKVMRTYKVALGRGGA
jgi:hypothetical protein